MRLAAFLILLALLDSCRGSRVQNVTCPDGTVACGDECINLQNDIRHCGSCEHACQVNEECTAGVCEPICAEAQHACGGACVFNSSLQSCGASCSPCPSVVNGLGFCDGKSCGVVCDFNMRLCGGSCAPCPAGVGAKCSGNQCVSSGCPAGQHVCNGDCVDENGGSCGDACLSCPTPPTNGFQVCLNGGCEYLCRPGNRWCGAGCCPADFMEVGAFHSCQITPTGAVLCWGRNHLEPMISGGQLGTGDRMDRARPISVTGLPSGIVAVQLGDFHTCAMDQFGAVWCWGWAQGGRLGDGTTSDKLTANPVMGMGQGAAVAISAGGSGACALSGNGEVRCWGENLHGESGDGVAGPHLTPTLVADLGTGAEDVSYGGSHACALMRGGTVKCWGDNARGQLGDASQTERPRPVLVMGLFDAVRISAGEQHTCAVRSTGEVQCWGDNAGGQLGLASAELFRSTPGAVTGLQGATAVSAGGAHTCALLGTGQVRCWGANESGQLGDGTTVAHAMPAAVSDIADGTSISAGHAHTCARTQSGTRCWGNNEFGQLGDGSAMNRLVPISP